MAEIPALIRNAGSGILTGFIDVYSAVIDVWMKMFPNPGDEFLVVFLSPLQVALERGCWHIQGRRWKG
jgi:hypothetical protein